MVNKPNTLIGTVFKQQYTILEEIGRGGMATVYSAMQHSVNRKITLKVLPPHFLHDPGFLERFEREVEVISHLEHPHILPIYDYGESDGIPFIAMRYLGGGNMAQLVRRGVPSLQDIVKPFQQVAEALDYAHHQGIIHRDLKPSNVMLDEFGNAYLTDFGIARVMGSNLTGSAIIGTPAYMSPEQASGVSLDARSDIYSLGIVLFELITGREPYQAETPMSMLLKHINEPIPPISDFRSNVPETVQQVLDKATAKDPDERYDSAIALAEDFRRALQGLPSTFDNQKTSPFLPTYDDPPTVIGISDTGAFEVSGDTMTMQFPPNAETNRDWRRLGSIVVILVIVISAFVLFGGAIRETIGSVFSSVASQVSVPSNLALLAVILSGISGVLIFIVRVFSRNTNRSNSVAAPPSVIQNEHTAFFESNVDINPTNGTVIEAPIKVGNIPQQPPPQEFGGTHIYGIEKDLEHSSSQRFKLSIIEAPRPEFHNTYALPNEGCTIGYDRRQNEVVIDFDKRVSKRHARITFSSDGLPQIEDLGSSNGTIVNGVKIPPREPITLYPGSMIRLSSKTVLSINLQQTFVPDLEGKTLAGIYTIEELINRSGKAVIYRGFDKKFSRDVVIKVLSPEYNQISGFAGRLEQEGTEAGRLQHPHIVNIFDFGSENIVNSDGYSITVKFIVMQLLSGGTLNEHKEMSRDKLITWLQEIGDAIDYVHQKNLVHCGIKPNSIILDESDKAHLTDFALAQHSGTSANQILVGSPPFIAPEQWSRVTLTPHVDQFALAVVVYHLLCGEYPYQDINDPDKRRANFEQGAPLVHERIQAKHGEPVPPAVSEVLQKALSVRPEDRFDNIKDFVNEFVKAISDKTYEKDYKRVFVSYRREGSAMLAHIIGTRLEEKYQIPTFTDTRTLDGATQFPKRLHEAIENCDVFVCLLAETTLGSEWVNEEILTAYKNGKPMIPIFQESFYSGNRLSREGEHVETLFSYDGVHFFDKRNVQIERSVEDLASMIQQTIGGDVES